MQKEQQLMFNAVTQPCAASRAYNLKHVSLTSLAARVKHCARARSQLRWRRALLAADGDVDNGAFPKQNDDGPAALADAAQAGSGAELAAVARAATEAERKWLAADLAAALHAEVPPPAMGNAQLSAQQEELLAATETLRTRHPLRRSREAPLLRPALPSETLHRKSSPQQQGAEYSVRAGRDGSFWSVRKRPQIMRMLSVIEELLRAHPQFGFRQLHVVDVGGGKGALALELVRARERRQRR
eukprot:4282425-Pleurochrysis_carterae.AAC.1